MFTQEKTASDSASARGSEGVSSGAHSITEATRFLDALDSEAEVFTFQTFDDKGLRGELARTIHGSIDEVFDTLSRLNDQGAGIFVTVNETDGTARKVENIVRVRAVFADFDPPKTRPAPARYPLEPHIVVESSPGKHHVYWLSADLSLDAFTPTQKALITALGSDPAPNDLPRVMRLPGFDHHKTDIPYRVRLIHAERFLDYPAAAIAAAFPAVINDRHTEAPSPDDDVVVEALRREGLLLKEKAGGGWFITCPWVEEHTTPSTPTSTVYYPAHTGGYQGAAFKCQHGHCTHRTARDLEERLGIASSWPELLPIGQSVPPEAYPLDALPKLIREAVEEVQQYNQAPTALVATSALTAVSTAIQTRVDVQRSTRLSGPVGLYGLVIADSGERKTSCDKFFSGIIESADIEAARDAKPEVQKHQADMRSWESECSGLSDAIRQAKKAGKPVDALRADLESAYLQKPEAPRVQKLLRLDDTPENLAYVMHKQWPAAGVLSSEAGVIFGSHGMGKDSIVRNLAQLNVLWDGGTLDIGRKTSESFTLRGARLTLGLMIQPQTLRTFFESSGALARGTGFLARFLVAWPQSTQGQRMYREEPAAWPALTRFQGRLGGILRAHVSITEDGQLDPIALKLSREAKEIWVEFHNAVEAELRPNGELYEVRDVASKVADNAARLAALFHVFEHGDSGTIDGYAMESGTMLAAWHLHEARRFFTELAVPEPVLQAQRLESWLIGYCRQHGVDTVARREVQRLIIPSTLRRREALDPALRELAEAGRVREITEGKRKLIRVRAEVLT